MSLESALDEERREVMNILEGRTTQTSAPANLTTTSANPAPAVRSMLDITGPVAPRHGSIANIEFGVTMPALGRAPITRSMLDPMFSPPPNRLSHSVTTSPANVDSSSGGIGRAQSDAVSHPPNGWPRPVSDRDRAVNPTQDYQFNMLPSLQSQALPKRVTQGGKKQGTTSSRSAIMQRQEPGPFQGGRESGRHSSTAGILGSHSKSPSSHGSSMLNTNSLNLMPTPGKFVTDGGKIIDMNNAYRKLSDAALLKSGGNLSNLPGRNTERVRVGSGEVSPPNGGVRLQKDYYETGEDMDGPIESSDENSTASSGEDGWTLQSIRGRKRSRRKKGPGSADVDTEDSENDGVSIGGATGETLGMGRAGGPRKVKSLLIAAKEERKSTD